jgi:carbon monoxide dehydrogenase subunit G
MAGPYRHQALIEAPLEDVWEVVIDPRTHPDWWPEVMAVEGPEQLSEGGEYVRKTASLVPFVDAVETIWVVERLDHLREARFRCTVSGAMARFTLTSAQADTYVELEADIDPTSLKWRLVKPVFGLQFKKWIIDVLDALPAAIRSRADAGAAVQKQA